MVTLCGIASLEESQKSFSDNEKCLNRNPIKDGDGMERLKPQLRIDEYVLKDVKG